MMRAVSLAVVLISALFGAANAQTRDQQLTWCEDQNPDVAIIGCTVLIESGQEAPKDLVVALYNRGNAYDHKGQHDLAIQDYDQAIRLNPNFAEAFHNRGHAYADKGQYDPAIEDYDQAIRLNPNWAEAFNNRSRAYSDKGQHDRAIQDLNQAIRLNPNFAEAFYNRGHAYADKGQYDPAIQDLDQAIRLNPNFAEAFYNRGHAYADKGQYDRAIQDYDQAIRLNPNWAEPFHNRGVAYRSLDQQARAAADFARAEQLASAPFSAQLPQPAAGFDLAGALKAGYSLAEIVEYLAPRFSFDLASARAAGIPDGQIASYLTAKPIPPPAPLPPPASTGWSDLGLHDWTSPAYPPPLASAAAARAQASIDAEIKALDEEYPDWRRIVGAVDISKRQPDPNSAYRKWLATKDAAYQALINSSTSAAVIAGSIRAFQAETKTLTAATRRGGGARDAPSVHDIYERARSSVVLLVGYDANNQPLALGSGFFVKSDIIATNLHVIEGASSVKAKYMSGEVATITTISGIDPDHDVVLLESPIHQSGLPLQLSNPDIGEAIVAIGNPRGLEGTVSTGIVSGIRRDKADTYYQITAPISPGSSGGPIVNQDGQVIGISTFYLAQGQNLNFAVPATYVDHLLVAPRKIALSARTQLSKPRVVVQGHENVTVIDPFITGAVYDMLEASVFNGTENTIKNVRIIAILHKESVGEPIVDYIKLEVSDDIPPHLSKRFSHHDSDLAGHGDDGQSSGGFGVRKGRWVADFRVLDYEIIKDIAGDLGIPR